MPDWLIAVILGFIEGLTEFIPVSSTGHLLIAQHWIPRQSDLFNIVIQSGAVLAVLPLFSHHMRTVMHWREPKNRDLILKVFVAFFITGVGGLILDKLNYELPEEVGPVAWALIIGGILFVAIEWFLKGKERSSEISWAVVFAVAIAQLVAAVAPGASRSGSTILFALMLGTNRVIATEFSFLVGIPTLLAAGGLKMFKALRAGVQEDWAMLALAAVVSAVVSFIAVKWLLKYVQSHSFVGFGVYRIILGAVLLLLPWFLK
ncbi:MAG: undecaprenyl-diphosphate phosphatase [Verrucomicrobiaceae bacterium]|nr:MAG: undecaprenyl-diphosphate phosphatase [Verrucomicrobiaceae bacterium]